MAKRIPVKSQDQTMLNLLPTTMWVSSIPLYTVHSVGGIPLRT